MTDDDQKLAAAKLLLNDVRDQREALDRREADLAGLVAQLEARIAATRRNGAPPPPHGPQRPRSEDPASAPEETVSHESGDQYGAITHTVMQIYRDTPKRLNAQQVADILEGRHVAIRAKNYYEAARTSIRRLHQTGRLKRVGTGFYRPEKNAEAQAAT